jgi:hypothetical protein
VLSLKKKIRQNSSINNKNEPVIPELGWGVWFFLVLAIILIIVSFFSPYLFTLPSIISSIGFDDTGEIGDTIGGLMNPFIAIAGVIVTGLAFYIQYKANQIQQYQITRQNTDNEIQKFESQFYEMLRLHRENVTEMKITGYDFEEKEGFRKFEKITEGRKVFVTMQTEFESILASCSSQRKLDRENYQKCYDIFFSGLDDFAENFPEDDDLTGALEKLRIRHQNPEKRNIKFNDTRKKGYSDYNLNFNYKPFSGHASRLGHYFRHLYLTVKSIDDNEIIKGYEDKMKYLRILRAQLSNHEQVLLFYNWLGSGGGNWENDKHSFFTDYKMIHNLPVNNLFSSEFIDKQLNHLRSKKPKHRLGRMFEIDELNQLEK